MVDVRDRLALNVEDLAVDLGVSGPDERGCTVVPTPALRVARELGGELGLAPDGRSGFRLTVTVALDTASAAPSPAPTISAYSGSGSILIAPQGHSATQIPHPLQ